MSQLDYNQTQEYYGEYKHGFFGNVEQIFICFAAQYVSGRGFVFDHGTGKFDITQINYKIGDVEEIESSKFDGKPCSVVRTTSDLNDVYLPGLTVMTPILKNSFSQFKEMSMQLEAEKLKVEAATSTKSSANLSLEEEIAEFKEKVNKLKIMKENGVLSPDEFQVLKLKLMDLYN